ncbi:RED-like protein N-terminal region-domain-containing protein [Trametes elegans]|nr:RED-like protein N-terminal region-domain-containing protein [Trametes elegans]
MDQESFRKLLQTPKPAASSSAAPSAHVRGSLLAAAKAGRDKKAKTAAAAEPAFKPRQVKKGAKGDAYRDRAAERRLGVGNDYAQVEALADEFERRNAENEDREAVEEQRKYLGGDSEHTVLVKGLDFALLEQARARAAAETAATEDVSLEQAFLESAAQPKKRTRADILRELKSKRGVAADGDGADGAAQAAADKALEEAKKAGKFRPIGFKPVGGAGAGAGDKSGKDGKRKKKAKAGAPEENGERKKKRKLALTAATQGPPPAQKADVPPVPGSSDANASAQAEADPSGAAAAEKSAVTAPPPPPEREREPVDEDFDIFADAGEYTGVDLGDDSDESDAGGAPAPKREDGEEGEVQDDASSRPPPRKWLATSDDERESEPVRGESQPPPPPARSSRSVSPRRHGGPSRVEEGEMEEDEEERPVRLQPLASSTMPSIKDLLAMSEEAEKAEKRRARKEKKKAGGGGGGGAGGEKDTKAKVERDYQRLKAYTDKKSKAPTAGAT